MVRLRIAVALGLVLAFGLVAVPRADVKTQQKTQVKFEGMLGRVAGLFGGKTAREGSVTTVAVQGNRKATVTDNTKQIVDLAEEKVYDVDLRGKSYRVTTFAEIRKQMEEAQARAREQMAEAREEAKQAEERKRDPNEKEFEVDFDVKATGQARSVNGFDCKQAITTITVREKGRTLEQSGGIVLTADSWLASSVAGLSEMNDFDRRYAEKLLGPVVAGGAADQMAAMLAMWPGMKEALTRYQAEAAKAGGTPILTTVTVEGVQSQEQAAQSAKQEEERPSGMGGVLGGLGRRLGKKKDEGASAGSKTRATIMTMNTEVLSVATSVAPDDVAIPAGFKQK